MARFLEALSPNSRSELRLVSCVVPVYATLVIEVALKVIKSRILDTKKFNGQNPFAHLLLPHSDPLSESIILGVDDPNAKLIWLRSFRFLVSKRCSRS